MKTAELYDAETSRNFYEERYSGGYMDEWPRDKVEKIREVLARAALPPAGVALDYGCGTGFFSQVLADALPGWRVVGTDISPAALHKARARHPSLEFLGFDDPGLRKIQADFLFTHHVIEHVPDLQQACAAMVALLAPRARMLHVLPCGNPGSLSHTLCRLRQDGIDPSMHNRFFFEDEGHVRRLRAEELVAEFAPGGFRLLDEFYTGQFWGTIDYFTRNEPDLVPRLVDPAGACGRVAALRLRALRVIFGGICAARRLNRTVRAKRALPRRTAKAAVLLRLGAPLFAASEWLECTVGERAAAEWELRKRDPRGDQMFLLFASTPRPSD